MLRTLILTLVLAAAVTALVVTVGPPTVPTDLPAWSDAIQQAETNPEDVIVLVAAALGWIMVALLSVYVAMTATGAVAGVFRRATSRPAAPVRDRKRAAPSTPRRKRAPQPATDPDRSIVLDVAPRHEPL